MAIWQVSIRLSSRKALDKKSEAILFNSLERLAEVLPKEKSWSNSILQYGALDSTCLEIDTKSRRLDAHLRIDVRTISRDQLKMISEFANTNELKVKYKGKAYEPAFDVFADIIKQSDANRFVNNPEDFLKSLKD